MLDNHPQWDIPDTEEEDEEQEDSDGIEESEDDDEDNDWARAHTLSPPPPSSLYPPMDLATHSLLTPLKPESSQWGAAKPQTLTESPGTVYTHRALLHLTFAKSWTVTWTPTPRNSLFYRDLFIHFPLLVEENSVNTNRPVVCERVCVRVREWYVTLCVFVQVWQMDTRWTGGPIVRILIIIIIILALFFFSWQGVGMYNRQFHLQN